MIQTAFGNEYWCPKSHIHYFLIKFVWVIFCPTFSTTALAVPNGHTATPNDAATATAPAATAAAAAAAAAAATAIAATTTAAPANVETFATVARTTDTGNNIFIQQVKNSNIHLPASTAAAATVPTATAPAAITTAATSAATTAAAPANEETFGTVARRAYNRRKLVLPPPLPKPQPPLTRQQYDVKVHTLQRPDLAIKSLNLSCPKKVSVLLTTAAA
ncbi:hypothetical protein HDU84_007512, partial [Entophlyctis sp. JEL0112]